MKNPILTFAFASMLVLAINFPANAQHHGGHSMHSGGVSHNYHPYNNYSSGYGRLTPQVSIYYGNSGMNYYGGYNRSYGIGNYYGAYGYGNPGIYGGYGSMNCNPYTNIYCARQFFLRYGFWPY